MWGKILLGVGVALGALGVAAVATILYEGKIYTKINSRIDRDDLSEEISKNLKDGNYATYDAGLTSVSVNVTEVKRNDGRTYVSLVWHPSMSYDGHEMNLCSDVGTSLYAGERMLLSLS